MQNAFFSIQNYVILMVLDSLGLWWLPEHVTINIINNRVSQRAEFFFFSISNFVYNFFMGMCQLIHPLKVYNLCESCNKDIL